MILIGMVAQCNQSLAREWYFKPNVRSELIYDTNLQLRASRTVTLNGVTRRLKPEETVGGRLLAGSVIGSQTENSDIFIRSNVSFNRFNISNFNSVNFFLFPESWFQVSERDKLGISGKLFFDNTLSLERPSGIDITPGDLDETDDLLGVPRRRFTKSIRPEWNHSLSEKTALNLSYEFTDVTYENAEKTGRVDYSIHSGQLNISHVLTPKLQLFSNLSATLFSTPAIDSSTTYYTIQVGGNYKFSERWEAEIVAGGRYSISDFRRSSISPFITDNGQIILLPVSERDTNSGLGSLAYGSLKHNYQTGHIKLNLTQDIRPTGNGALQSTNVAGLDWLHNINERLTLRITANALRGSSINSDSNFLDRSFLQASPMLRWRFTPDFSLGMRYRYRYQKYDQLDNSAESHSVMLFANYQWQKMSISR
ncbi:MAG: hypothetical protein K0U68_03780 [Gammaproteobacteria bacterium]|nr:hypothetical protein [Gammaproteobacteria bacterium]